MDRRDYYLLFSRSLCTLLAVGSFIVEPLPARNTFFTEAFVSMKLSMLVAMIACPMFLLHHVGNLRHWDWAVDGPQGHFCYAVAVTEALLWPVYWGAGTAVLGVLTEPTFRMMCVREFVASCRSYEVACGLALATGALCCSNTLLLLSHRMRYGPRLLAVPGVGLAPGAQ
ncbi:hypothetical protein ACQJBY_030299 [Aegilops geniculata]